jgi:hypothetical protein
MYSKNLNLFEAFISYLQMPKKYIEALSNLLMTLLLFADFVGSHGPCFNR